METIKRIDFVLNRSGEKEAYDFSKIEIRLQDLVFGLNRDYVDLGAVFSKVLEGLHEGIQTASIDDLAAETCAYMNMVHPDYNLLAARISTTKLHKETSENFYEKMKLLHLLGKDDTHDGLLSNPFFEFVETNKDAIQAKIDYSRDMNYDYFGFLTLLKGYLMKKDDKTVERPQDMLMRVSLAIHLNDLERAFETYDLTSKLIFTHASPTLFNAGTALQQMSSCFLLMMKDDSIEGIYDTVKNCALISKSAGGIG